MSGLTIKNADIGPCGLNLPPSLSWEQWLEVGQSLGQVERGIQWLIGDWWAYGEHEYGMRLKACADIPGLPSYQTCKNYGSVSRAFERSRRRDVLSFSHHETVAALDPPDADKLLKQAERKGWSREDLRAALAAGERSASGGNGQQPPAGRDVSGGGMEPKSPQEPPSPQHTDTPAEQRGKLRSVVIQRLQYALREVDDMNQLKPFEAEDYASLLDWIKGSLSLVRKWK